MITLEPSTSFYEAFQILPMVETLDAFYPDVGHWYVSTVIPGLLLGKDKLILAKDNQRIVGFAIGKLTEAETKLRCVRVLPEHQQHGVGIRLIDKMIEMLEASEPVVTVSEEMINHYSRIFVNRYGWRLNHVSKGTYRKGKLEYHFN